MKKVFIASDHAGFELKNQLLEFLNHSTQLTDLGTNSSDSVDYPDFAKLVCQAVLADRQSFGILLCGSGIGMSIAANRFKGIRAALVWNSDLAKLSRQHNNANVLVLPARFISREQAESIVDQWLNTSFDGGRHEKRIEKLDQI